MADETFPRVPAAPSRARKAIRPLIWPLAGAAALIATLAGLAILGEREQRHERESARLEAVADLRAGQVSTWLREKLGQARFAGNSPLGELYLRWRDTGDTGARDRLVDRLSSFHKASGGHSVLVMDDKGLILAGDPPDPQTASPELLAAARRAIERDAPQFTHLYGYDGPAPAPRLDVVAPLTLTGKPAQGVVVLRLNPEVFLFPTLSHWPVPTQSGTALLVRRDGEELVGPRGRTRVPLSTPDLLVARVLRGELPQGKAVEGLDFRGRPVLGVVQRVQDTDWFLVTKIDRDEVYAESHRNAAVIAAAGVLALLATGALAYWLRERRTLRQALAEQDRHEADRLRLEELVAQRTLELAAKNRALERTVLDLEAFSASVSHDLRGPLRTVNGFASLLERRESPNLSAEGRRQLGRIVAGVATMDRMIEDILQCSRAEQVEMHFSIVNLDLLVRDLIAQLAPAYPGTAIEAGMLPLVNADPTMAYQVFANLIDNALKFSARQPAPRVEIGIRGEPGAEFLFVRDNGVGFDPALAGRLFAPFQRLHSDEDYPGTGVGLSIVKRLIERHGGSIEADSRPGQTTFIFSFGKARAPQPREQAELAR